LVPFYFLDHFLLSSFFKKKIKCIVFNYFRKNISNHIKYSSQNGKFNIIYDTEGAPGKDGLQLYKLIESSKENLKYIDNYIFWGHAQKEAIEKKIQVPFIMTVGGYIRFHQKFDHYEKKKILINTNFAFSDPKFNTKKNEIKELNKLGYSDLAEAETKSKEIHSRKFFFLKALDKIISSNPIEEFILRPHPFEDIKDYQIFAKKYKNFSFDNSLTSVKSLKRAKLLVHLDCTTAIEAFYSGIPVLSLNWLKNNQKTIFELAEDIGYQAKNIDDAVSFISSKKYLNYKQSNEYETRKKLEKFFGSFKENSIEKVSGLIAETINQNKKKKNFFKFLNLKSYIKVFLFNSLHEKIYSFLIKLYRGERLVNSRKFKSFTKIQIENELNYKLSVDTLSKKFFIIKATI